MQPKKADKTVSADETFDTVFDEGIKITSAFLHQALTGGGLPAERTINGTKFRGIEMSWTPMGLLIKWKTYRIGVPQANVANWNI